MAVATRRFPVAISLRQVRRMGSRLGWGVTDQGAASLSNFLLNILVARMLGAEQFGAFALVYVTYGFTLNAVRGLSIEPLLVRFSGTDNAAWRRAASGSAGSAVLVGLVTGIFALAAGLVIGGTTGRAFLAFGLILPALMVQEAWRFAFFAAAKGYNAFIIDVTWAVVQAPLMLMLRVVGYANVFWFVVAWGAGALASVIVGAFLAKVVPSLGRAFAWVKTHRDLGPRFLVENCGSNAASMLQSYTISGFLGVESVGYMQSANVLMGPFKILSFGIGLITISEAAVLMRRSPKKGLRFCIGLSAGQTALGVLCTIALLIGLPLGLGRLILGSLWAKAYPLLLPTALTVIAGCASSGSSTGLHAVGAAKRSMRVALITAAMSFGLSLVGVGFHSVMLTLWLVAAANWVGATMSWLQLRQAMRELGIRSRGRHHKPATLHAPRSRAAKNIRDVPVAAVAVSRPAAHISYVRETRQGMPHAASPGEEMR